MVLSPESTKPFHWLKTFLYWNRTPFLFSDSTAFVLQFVNWAFIREKPDNIFVWNLRSTNSLSLLLQVLREWKGQLGGWAKPLLWIAKNCISFPVTLLWRCRRGTPNSKLAAGTTGTKDEKLTTSWHEEKWRRKALARRATNNFQHLNFVCRYKFHKD